MQSRSVGPTLEVASAGRQSFRRGDLAQLGERFHGMEEVTGSNPVISTNSSLVEFGEVGVFGVSEPPGRTARPIRLPEKPTRKRFRAGP